MTLRMFLAVGLCAVAAAPPVAARDLSVVTRPEMLQAQDDAYFKPFTAAFGTPVRVLDWTGGLPILRSRVEGGTNDWDIVLVAADELLAGCDDGLFEKLNWAAIGGRDHYIPQASSDCGVGATIGSLVLAWDRDKFSATPSWADFWDVARYPGKRGLRRTARSNLEIALLADGVTAGDVYRVLRTDDGVDRAFRKLDQIKPYLVWWAPDAPAAQLLGSGEVLMSSADNASVTLADRTQKRHFGLQWAGSLYSIRSWIIMKGSPNIPDALKLLAFAGDPARQAGFASAVPYGPSAKGATDQMAADALAVSPAAPANLQNALQVDEQFWRENGDKLNQRFLAWLAH
jgi:putative spermidine/putrescine transport system substrate-binding protein